MSSNDQTPPAASDAAPPLGRRARKALAARQTLFQAGLAAFERQPIGLVSILDITEAADVAKGVFYLHFRSKDAYLLELWEEVQRSFLDDIRAATAGARSRAARIEAIVSRYMALATHSSAAARYWIRLSSYFPDEVGEPGRLTGIHSNYARQLAAIIAAREVSAVTSADVRTAIMADALCWAVLQTQLTNAEACCDERALVQIINAAIKAISRSE